MCKKRLGVGDMQNLSLLGTELRGDSMGVLDSSLGNDMRTVRGNGDLKKGVSEISKKGFDA